MQFRFEPKRAWLGSANWTKHASQHLEFGLWTTDAVLVERTYRFVLDVIRFSEPFDTATDHPEPELIAAEWDDAAPHERRPNVAMGLQTVLADVFLRKK